MTISNTKTHAEWDLELQQLRDDVAAFASAMGDNGYLTEALEVGSRYMEKYSEYTLGKMPEFLEGLPLPYSVCAELYQISVANAIPEHMLILAKGKRQDRKLLIKRLEEMVHADRLLARACDLKGSKQYCRSE